jgi:methylenetetrahydrofolate--tRNA-(uracil-5-)-methyltransferase
VSAAGRAAPLAHVVGGGLAGCEAALQLARCGAQVMLHEMRPDRLTPAHRTGGLAEIVCSNSLKSADSGTASGLLKLELDRLGCRLLEAAREAAVPAGAALAVDRELFSAAVAARIAAEPAITVVREAIARPADDGVPWILATGPLTTPELIAEVGRLSGRDGLHFYDAIAPTVTLASLDLSRLYRAARYGRGEADYLNAALDEPAYRTLVAALVGAEKAEVEAFDRQELFPGCQPIEEIAASGPDSLAFGPLRPVGLRDPRGGPRPFAVVQLRQEDRAGSLYGLVGFQTRLKQGEQRRVFRTIPGLAEAEFVRYGQLHRNFYLDTPRALDRRFALTSAPAVRFAGQVTGVEGYVESIASGLVTAWLTVAELRGIDLPPWPGATLIGSLLFGFLFDRTAPRLTPMNANFGLLPPLPDAPRGRRERNLALGDRSLAALDGFVREPLVARLLG